MSDFDSPWKEALDFYLADFLRFFFIEVHNGIDWNRDYEILDKELTQIVRDAELGNRLADKLFKVWLNDGQELWLLIHVEIQSQHDKNFARRMYEYHYRIFEKFNHEVVSLAVLADDSPKWHPSKFEYNNFGCRLTLEFLTAKLMDYQNDLEALEADENPFGFIVLVHLHTIATRENPGDRCDWKIRLAKGLLDKGWDAERVRQFFKFVDWMMDLPDVLTQKFDLEIEAYEKEKAMPYITTYEQRGIEKGKDEGRRETVIKFLEYKFGKLSSAIQHQVQQLSNEQLSEIEEKFLNAKTLQELGLGTEHT